MNCRMTRGVYLRANGEVNCYCSTGEQISLAQLPTAPEKNWNFLKDAYFGGRFTQLREAMSEDRLPFPVYCLKCNYFNATELYEPELLQKEIEWAHLEAAALCNLRCPFCVHGIPIEQRTYRREPPYLLPRELYSRMLRDVKETGMGFKWMYFSGRGEPTLHPELWDMVAEAKELFETDFLVNTNGNASFHPVIVDSGLDKIKIALDSHIQEQYARYRVKGNVDTVLRLTEAIAEYKARTNSSGPSIIWQKVLFNYNDSDEELIAYQELAERVGVDRIRLVFTFTEGQSERRPGETPVIFPNVEILDAAGRDNIQLAEMRRLREQALTDNSIPKLISLANALLHWFQLGAEDREQYDTFANLPPYHEGLLKRRFGDPDFKEYCQSLADTFGALGCVYSKAGLNEEAVRYTSWGERMKDADSGRQINA